MVILFTVRAFFFEWWVWFVVWFLFVLIRFQLQWECLLLVALLSLHWLKRTIAQVRLFAGATVSVLLGADRASFVALRHLVCSLLWIHEYLFLGLLSAAWVEDLCSGTALPSLHPSLVQFIVTCPELQDLCSGTAPVCFLCVSFCMFPISQ